MTSNNFTHRIGVFSPAGGRKRLVLFLDDLNMPQGDAFGTQAPLELFRQLLDQNSLYTFGSAIESARVLDTLLLGAMTPSAGRSALSPRFLRHLHLIALQTFDDETIHTIYAPLLDFHFNEGFENSLRRFSRV